MPIKDFSFSQGSLTMDLLGPERLLQFFYIVCINNKDSDKTVHRTLIGKQSYQKPVLFAG